MAFWRACSFCFGLLILFACSPPPEGQSDEQKDPFFVLGTRLVKERDFKAAVNAFEKALELNPRSVMAHYELGLLYETKLNDPAIALYHYKQVLRLQPNGQPAEIVQARVKGCEQEIAKTVALAQVDPAVMAELDRLKEENRRLQRDLETLRTLAARIPSAGGPGNGLSGWKAGSIELPAETGQGKGASDFSRPSPQDSNPVTPPVSATGINPRPAVSPLAASPGNSNRARLARTHYVKSKETFSSIARQYGISMASLRAANPWVNPERLKIGQSIVIPGAN